MMLNDQGQIVRSHDLNRCVPSMGAILGVEVPP